MAAHGRRVAFAALACFAIAVCASSGVAHAQDAPGVEQNDEQRAAPPDGAAPGQAAAPEAAAAAAGDDAQARDAADAANGPRACVGQRLETGNCWDFTVLPGSNGLWLLIVLAIALLAALAAINWRFRPIPDLKPSFFFWIGMIYTVLLLGGAFLYTLVHVAPGRPWLIAGLLPIGVPWFGALGAVTISLAGVFHYGERHWDAHFNFWHLGRPVFGAVLGIVAFFSYIVVVTTSGTTPAFLNDPATPPPLKDFVIFYVLAFLVGYREETFRQLITRVTDMIFTSTPPVNKAPAITIKLGGVVESKVKFKDAAVGAAAQSLDVEIHNTSGTVLTDVDAVLIPARAVPAGVFTPLTFTGPAQLAVNGKWTVKLTFAPAAAGTDYSAVLTVLAGSGSIATTIPVTGRST